MFDENYRNWMKLAEELREQIKKETPEQAFQRLIRAGIFDNNGNYTEPYKILEEYTASK